MVSVWLRLEGAILFCLSVFMYDHYGQSWMLFIALLFVPDISILGYLKNSVWGARMYNLFHIYFFPALCLLFAVCVDNVVLRSVAIIWFSHIGLDRCLGYGLKLTSGFKHTHLGVIGR